MLQISSSIPSGTTLVYLRGNTGWLQPEARMIATGSTELKFPFLQASVWGRCDVSTRQKLVQSTLFWASAARTKEVPGLSRTFTFSFVIILSVRVLIG